MQRMRIVERYEFEREMLKKNACQECSLQEVSSPTGYHLRILLERPTKPYIGWEISFDQYSTI